MAAIIPEVLPTLVESGAGAVRGVLAAGESAISGAESVVESGSQIVSNIERVSNSGLGLANKVVETLNRFLDTPIGGLVAGGTGIAFLKHEIEHKNIDIKVNDVDYNNHSPFVTPQPIPVQQNREDIKQQYAPTLSKVQQIINAGTVQASQPLTAKDIIDKITKGASPLTRQEFVSNANAIQKPSGPVTPSVINPPYFAQQSIQNTVASPQSISSAPAPAPGISNYLRQVAMGSNF